MGSTAGLNDASTFDIVMGILYGLTAVVLLATAYSIYTKQFRRKRMEEDNTVNFVTAQYNIYKSKTQLLVETPAEMLINVVLLDENEKEVDVLLNETVNKGEKIIVFNPLDYNPGSYFLQLIAPSTHILKKIVISRT